MDRYNRKKTESIKFNLTKKLKSQIDEIAKIENLSHSRTIEMLLTKYITKPKIKCKS